MAPVLQQVLAANEACNDSAALTYINAAASMRTHGRTVSWAYPF